MNFFSRFTSPYKNHAKLAVFITTILLVINLFASVDTITILNGTECEQTGVCHYRMQFSSWFSINPSYPEDYDYYRNIKDPQNNWHSTNGTLLDCMSSGVCTAIASDHVDFNYTHPDSGAVVVNMQVEDYWGGDYAAATLYHSVELFTVPDSAFQSCITDEMTDKNYTNINQITTLSCNSVALTSIEGVEMLTSLVSLNIAGSSVSDLSPVLQSGSLLSLSLLDGNTSGFVIEAPERDPFWQLIREHIACRRLYIPSCYDAIYVGDCPPPFFTDRCDNGTCHYDHVDNTSYCVPWYEEEVVKIKDTEDTPIFYDGNSSWNNFVTGTQNVNILGGSTTASVETYEGKFVSWEYNNGGKSFIQIHFHAAKPADVTEKLPLLIISHGGVGFADYEYTNTLAAELNMFVIYYSGPGRGPYKRHWEDNVQVADRDNNGALIPINYPINEAITYDKWSTGTDHTYYGYLTNEGIREDRHDKFFDSSPDPRGSWMWGHAVAAMRAITLASLNDDIDMENVAITGGSAGGIATLLASSVDDRIKVAVPTISSLAIEDAVAFDEDLNELKSYSWINTLRHCTDSGLDDTAPNWVEFIDQIVGKDALITRNSVPTLFLNGATDEFFPLNALNSTYNAMDNNSLSRLSIQYKRGHDWLTPQNDDPPGLLETIHMRLNGGIYHWLKSHLSFPNNNQNDDLNDNRIPSIPNAPTVTIDGSPEQYKPQVIIDNPFASNVGVTVAFYYSTDQGLSYQKVELVYDNNDDIYIINENGVLDSEFNFDTSFHFADVIYTFPNNSNNIKNFYKTFYLSSQPVTPSIPNIPEWAPPTCKSFPDEPSSVLMW
ncbi:hypothetical protein KAH37_04290 [bacterium]|nr:hypothetical protein [bacterium]